MGLMAELSPFKRLSQRRDDGNPMRKSTGNETSRQTVFKRSSFFSRASQRRDDGNPMRKSTGNETSRQTVFGTKVKPSSFFSHASQRRDDGNPMRKSTGNGTSRQTVFGTKVKPSSFFSGNRNGINKLSHSTLVIDVDEDIGERPQSAQERSGNDSESSDSLDSLTQPTYDSSRPGHNASLLATRKDAGPSKRVSASDGPPTKRLHIMHETTSPGTSTNHVDDSDDDPIQIFSDPDGPEPTTRWSSPRAKPGAAKENVKLFESMSKQSKPPIRSQTSAKLSTDNIRRLNLTKMTVIERLKPKPGPHVRPLRIVEILNADMGHYKPTVSDHPPRSGALGPSSISLQSCKKTRSRYSGPSAPAVPHPVLVPKVVKKSTKPSVRSRVYHKIIP
ncbi:hypothetical protein EIP86_006525 [Pleurotus ostreatoroseus]|nr:hypothetical protein EIP86_006525 [Pleurotus ostreatoroseus]